MMKMVLWVEDDPSAICKVFNDSVLTEGLGVKAFGALLDDKYHIHRVDNLDDALTAVNERDYDYYLLDIEFPEYDSDGDGAENQNIISSFMESDLDKSSFDRMRAGQYLFMHLLPTKNISQLRIYSAHIEQTKTLKAWADESGLSIDWDKVIFDKASDADKTAQAVKGWLTSITKSPERILRHAMIDGCDALLDQIQSKTNRELYSRIQRPNNVNTINPSKIKRHVELFKAVVNEVGIRLEDCDAVSYRSLLIMLLTSDCQEHMSESNGRVKLDDDFERLAGVFIQIRNLFEHHNTLNPNAFTIQFVAMLFLIYIRSRCHSDSALQPFEKNILNLFKSFDLKNIEDCANEINRFVHNRCDVLKPVKGYERLSSDKKWEKPKDGYYSFQKLLGSRKFIHDKKYQYEVIHCYQLMIINLLNYNRPRIQVPKACFHDNNREWSIKDVDISGEEKFSTNWYDKYFKAFYSYAIPRRTKGSGLKT